MGIKVRVKAEFASFLARLTYGPGTTRIKMQQGQGKSLTVFTPSVLVGLKEASDIRNSRSRKTISIAVIQEALKMDQEKQLWSR